MCRNMDSQLVWRVRCVSKLESPLLTRRPVDDADGFSSEWTTYASAQSLMLEIIVDGYCTTPEGGFLD